MKPSISIILAVYNGGEYLKKSVESILQQQFTDFELLILDDCSNDGSWQYLQTLKSEKIFVYRNEVNRGLFYNLNWLINRSNAPLIKLWSQDDIMYPHCLSSFVDFHGRHPGIGFSYSDRDMIDENGKIKKNNSVDHTPEIISTELHARIAYYTGSIAGNIANVCISKTALDKVGLFKEDMKISADFDMWVRLAEYYETGFVKQKLIQLRDHEGQLSRNEKYYINHVREDLEVYRYLDNYAAPDLRKEGKLMMSNHKMVFYYTLMVKAFLKMHFHTGMSYFKLLSSYDNFLKLSWSFVKSKMKKPAIPALNR